MEGGEGFSVWGEYCNCARYNNDITMIMIIIIDNHNHDNGNHNNDITMIIMLTVTTVTRREYFQMDICVTFVVVVLVESPLQKLNIIWKC